MRHVGASQRLKCCNLNHRAGPDPMPTPPPTPQNAKSPITLLLTATPLRLPIPARQNLTEMPIYHLRRLQRIPPSLLRRNISDRKVKRTNHTLPTGEASGKLIRHDIRGENIRLVLRGSPSEVAVQGVAIFSSLRPGRIHPRLEYLDETIIGQHGELKGHDPPLVTLDGLVNADNTHAAHAQDGSQPVPTATPQEPKPPPYARGRQNSASSQQAAAPTHHRGQPHPGSKPDARCARAPRPPTATTHPPRYTPWRPDAHTRSQ